MIAKYRSVAQSFQAQFILLTLGVLSAFPASGSGDSTAVRLSAEQSAEERAVSTAALDPNVALLGSLHGSGLTGSVKDSDADLVGPDPLFRARWTHDSLRDRSLAGLAYQVRNDSPDYATFEATLTWDRGSSEAFSEVLETFTVAPHSREIRRLSPASLPEDMWSGTLPGMLRLSLASEQGGTHVLPAFYAKPRQSEKLAAGKDWPYELMTPEDLQDVTARSLQIDKQGDDGELPLRVVEWAAQGEGAAPTPSKAGSVVFRTCVRWQAQTNDSGHGEDRLSWADGANKIVTAYGVRIRMTATDGSSQQTFNTSSSSGCANWQGDLGKTYNVRVYYYVNDANGNIIRYHNGGDSVFGNYPGSTYYYQVNGYQPNLFATTYVNAGGWSPRATAMATASMVSRYFPGLTAGKQIHMSDDASCSGSSAHHCNGGSCNYSNDAYVRLEMASCGNGREFRRAKFVVAHELGHARAINQQGGEEPNVDSGLAGFTCAGGSGYSVNSREWNSVSMREGFAHFVATWTFNDPSDNEAHFRLFNTNFDVERNNPNLAGGRIENNCNGAIDGHGTNIDALRMLWDWATPTGAANRASRADVMNTYEGMVDASPARHQYFVRYYLDASSNLSTAKRNNLWSYACWNGLIPPSICNS